MHLKTLVSISLIYAFAFFAHSSTWYKGEGEKFRDSGIKFSSYDYGLNYRGLEHFTDFGEYYNYDWAYDSKITQQTTVYTEYFEYGLAQYESMFYGEFAYGHRSEDGVVEYRESSGGEMQNNSLSAAIKYPIFSLKLGQNFQKWRQENKVLSLGYEINSSEIAFAKGSNHYNGFANGQMHLKLGIANNEQYLETSFAMRRYHKGRGLAIDNSWKFGFSKEPFIFELSLNNLINYPYKNESRLSKSFLKYYGEHREYLDNVANLLNATRYSNYHSIGAKAGFRLNERTSLVMILSKQISASDKNNVFELGFSMQKHF